MLFILYMFYVELKHENKMKTKEISSFKEILDKIGKDRIEMLFQT